MANRKNPAAVTLGRLGGFAAKGAGIKALNARLTAKERSESARRASRARWQKKKH
jgi:hypothetical protein